MFNKYHFISFWQSFFKSSHLSTIIKFYLLHVKLLFHGPPYLCNAVEQWDLKSTARNMIRENCHKLTAICQYLSHWNLSVEAEVTDELHLLCGCGNCISYFILSSSQNKQQIVEGNFQEINPWSLMFVERQNFIIDYSAVFLIFKE